MIEKVELTNFMRHKQLVVDFKDGMNVVRGRNESGKSTILNAIAYALFGSRALDDSLGDTVTWGEPENSLRVKVTLSDGLVVSRGKSGAEVTSAGSVVVTGQSEVTSFCESRFGCDAATAPLLMFANQDAMRGVLTQPPAAAGALMESLTGMDVFERVVSAINGNLQVGSTVHLQENYDNAVREIEQVLSALKPPDEVAYRASIDSITAEIVEIKSELEKVKGELSSCEADMHRANAAVENLERVGSRIASLESQCETLQKQIASAGDTTDYSDDIESCNARISEINRINKLKQVHAALHNALVNISGVQRYPVDVIELDKMCDEAAERMQNLSNTKIGLQRDISVKEAMLIKESACSFCGLDISGFPEIAAKNSSIESQINDLLQLINEVSEAYDKEALELEKMRAAVRAQNSLATALAAYEDFLLVDETVTPNSVSLKFDVPVENDEELSAELRELKVNLAKYETAMKARKATLSHREKLAALTAQLESSRSEAVELESSISSFDVESLKKTTEDLKAEVRSLSAKLIQLATEQQRLESSFAEDTRNYDRGVEAVEKLKAEASSLKDAIEEMTANNALLRKVRAARPIVVSKLWNLLLGATSTMFTRLRGETSVVSRNERGFLVNGKSIKTGLSGSAKDMLALALRVALIKAFIPKCGLLVVDEPAHACDEARTAAMIGFLASCEFKQIIMVTHEEISENFADAVIKL